MTLITLLLVLSIERVAATSEVWQFEFYYLKMKSFMMKHLGKPQWLYSAVGLWLWLLLPVVLILFLASAFDWLLFEFVFNVAVLLVCIGCIEKRKTYKSFLNAAARNDERACELYAAKLQGLPVQDENESGSSTERSAEEPVEPSEQTLHSEADEANAQSEQDELAGEQKMEEPCGCHTLGLTLVWYNFRYYCAILFWFVVFGPAGAVLYCMVRESYDDKDEQVRGFLSKDKMRRILHVLDWLPARVFSLGYLLIGNFSKAAGIWLSYVLDLTSSAKALVSEISQAAETVDMSDCSKVTEPACMLKLAKRNILFFMALVALLTLYGGMA